MHNVSALLADYLRLNPPTVDDYATIPGLLEWWAGRQRCELELVAIDLTFDDLILLPLDQAFAHFGESDVPTI